jgi:hypothetical protein
MPSLVVPIAVQFFSNSDGPSYVNTLQGFPGGSNAFYGTGTIVIPLYPPITTESFSVPNTWIYTYLLAEITYLQAGSTFASYNAAYNLYSQQFDWLNTLELAIAFNAANPTLSNPYSTINPV